MDSKAIFPQSPPGWSLGLIAMLTIVSQGLYVFNPSGFMRDYELQNGQAAKMIGQYPSIALDISTVGEIENTSRDHGSL